VAQLGREGAVREAHLLERLLAAARAGLEDYAVSGQLREPAEYRLAFRELGLAIGLEGVALLAQKSSGANPAERRQIDALLSRLPLGDDIESFWRNPEHRASSTWTEHRDINEVMLATRLLPEGMLALRRPTSSRR
jgi:hypothetical protein